MNQTNTMKTILYEKKGGFDESNPYNKSSPYLRIKSILPIPASTSTLIVTSVFP